MTDKIAETVSEVVKQLPPTGVVAFTVMGYPISDWVQLATLLYVLLQVHVLCKKNMLWYQKFLKWFTKRGGSDNADIKGE